jgi:gamma-glutamylcyclotransferase (GGCT)/AIG2-like uncharacterized protein YtfP
MNDPTLLFVYGLLMSDEMGFQSLGLETRVRVLGPERISGRLHHLGDYPGLVIGKHGIVHGELFAFSDPGVLEDIDAYELYDPENATGSEYHRIEVDLLGSGKRAYAYEYNRPIQNRPIIATGNWRIEGKRAGFMKR